MLCWEKARPTTQVHLSSSLVFPSAAIELSSATFISPERKIPSWSSQE